MSRKTVWTLPDVVQGLSAETVVRFASASTYYRAADLVACLLALGLKARVREGTQTDLRPEIRVWSIERAK